MNKPLAVPLRAMPWQRCSLSLFWLLPVVLLASVALCHAAEPIWLLQNGDLSAWEEKSFAGETRYEAALVDGRTAIRAVSEASASGWHIKRRIDLRKTPLLDWYWRVDTPLTHSAERTKEGDDFAARVYVIVSHPLFPWKSKAVNYVWSSQQPIGSHWANPFVSAARHIALRSSTSPIGQWVHERRNVRADLKALFDSDVVYVDAVAIMTDTDNTKARAVAYYADISSSAE